MKKLLTQILCLLLVLATLLPMIVACKDDDVPPPDNDDDDDDDVTETGGITTVSASISGYTTLPILNLSDFDAIKAVVSNRNLANPDMTKSKPTVKWEISYSNPLTIELPEPVNINDYYYISFSIYADTPSSKTWKLEFFDQSNTSIGSTEIVMDFSGEQKFQLKQDTISVKNPVPSVAKVKFSCDDTSASGSYAYISSIEAKHPEFEYKTPENFSFDDASSYNAFLTNWVNYKTANNSDTLTTSAFTTAISKINSDCQTQWNEFKATYQEGVNGSLYGAHMYDSKLNYSGELAYLNDYNRYAKGILAVYQNVEKMALAYACKHSAYYQNKDLLADILKALEYNYEYGYGKPVLQNGTYGDWYPWDVSIPASLINILAYIRNDIDASLISKYLEPFNKLMPLPFGTAANLMFMTKNVLLASALTKDGKRIARANCLMQEVFTYIDEIPEDAPRTGSNDGFYTDGSFIQHGGVPYQGSYGIGLLQSLTPLMYIGSGTVFEITGNEVHHQYEWIFNSYLTIISGDRQFVSHDGRANTTTGMERANTHRMLGCALEMSAYAPEPYASQLKSMIKYFTVTVGTTPTTYVSISFLGYLDNLNNDASILPAEQYIAGKVFGNADTVVQHTADYSVCVAMSSTRIMKYESINGANETGWYHRDGMIYVYSDGYDFNKTNIFTCNPYLMPGTTVNLGERADRNIWPPIYGTNDYAGGVEQGNYAVAGMILSYSETAYTQKQKSFESVEATRISAKKSYFMFDNEIVCIGSDIQDESGKAVVTVVDNRWWGVRVDGSFKNVEETLRINGNIVTPETAETTIEARTMHFTNMGGYIFMDWVDGSTTDSSGNTVSYKKATYLPRESTGLTQTPQSFLEITINHGVNAENGKQYAYMYLPNATSEETEAYSSNPDVVMVRRNANCHAVLEKTLGIVAANIFNYNGASFNVNNSATAVKKVTAEACPASIMISKGENGEYHISVSDPTQLYRQLEIQIQIEGVNAVVSADSAVTVTVEDGVVSATINTKNALGATFDFTVKI